MNTIERILCAAVYFDDKQIHLMQPKNITSGFVVSGWRHPSCLILLGEINSELRLVSQRKAKGIHEVQGFLTSKNRFVDRKEAGQIAYSAGQLDDLPSSNSPEIYSEDLY